MRAFLVAAFVFLALGSAQAQVVFDANSTAAAGGSSVTSLSNTTLTIGSGSNRALIAQSGYGSRTLSITSCVWDPTGANQSLTLIRKQVHPSSGLSAELWGLVNPVSGNKTLTCNYSGSVPFGSLNGLSYSGANQTGGATTFYNSNSTTGTSSSTTNVTISSTTGDAAVEVGIIGQNDSAFTQTLVFDVNSSFGGYGQRAAGAASVSFGATSTPAGAWVEVATAINAAAVAATEHNLSLIGVGH